jgi:hypothetical protein
MGNLGGSNAKWSVDCRDFLRLPFRGCFDRRGGTGSGTADGCFKGRSVCTPPPTEGDWITFGRDYSNQRFAPLRAIDRSNVARLAADRLPDTELVRSPAAEVRRSDRRQDHAEDR